MKICKIKLKNIHSLKGEHTINFDEGVLADAGLFVITGPTGAGKSTLLDAITLALYNRIPRLDKSITETIIEEEGVILTKNTSDCFVEIEYLVADILYRSNWSIKRARTGNLSKRMHELVDVTNNKIISSSNSEVPKENQRIIGLNYEQFIQSMVLAQGQFSKLLLAKKDERNALLEEITGTKIYRTIGKKVFERHRTCEKLVHEQKIRMGEIELLSEQQTQEIQSALIKLKPEFDAKNELKNLLDKKQQVKKTIIENQQKLNDIAVAWIQFEVEKDSFKTVNETLAKHNQFVIYKEKITEFRSQEKNSAAIVQNIENKKTQIDHSVKQLDAVLTIASTFINKEVTLLNFEKELDDFQAKVAGYLEEETEILRNGKFESTQLDERIKTVSRNGITIVKNEMLQQQIEQQLDAIKLECNNLNVFSIAEVNAKTDVFLAKKNPAALLISKKQLFESRKENIESLELKNTNAQKIIEANSTAILEHQKQLDTLEPIVVQTKKELEDSRKFKSLDSYRAELQPDCPCPLCGALEHPFQTNHKEVIIDLLEEKLLSLEKQYKINEVQNLQLTAQNKAIQEVLFKDISEVETKKKELQIVENQIENECKSLEWDVQQPVSVWQNELQNLEIQLDKLSSLERLLLAKPELEALELNRENREKLLKKHSSLSDERKKYYTGTDIHKDTNYYVNQIKKAQLISEQNKADLIVLNQNEKETATDLKRMISELSAIFEPLELSVSQVEALMLSEVKANEIRNQLKALDEKETTLKATKTAIEKVLAEWIPQDDLTINLEELVAQITVIVNEVESLKKEIWNFEYKLKINDDNLIKQKKEIDALALLNKDAILWAQMNALIGDAMGKKFSNFVQDLTLKQLITYGNKRLEGFSDRYLISVDQNAESLKVIDSYMGNTQRAVSSLSGGETFKLSLALAFGLSDLAAKNVNIESLFIDEGFGTLDPESLDQAITLLENMQNNSNKSIGIISHVGELKDRIGAKIKLTRTSGGYSKVEIE